MEELPSTFHYVLPHNTWDVNRGLVGTKPKSFLKKCTAEQL